MYFHGTFSIDPSLMTNLELKKPTKAFGKMTYYMTLGLTSEKEEIETFTAVSILQQFSHTFLSMGITNVLRLAKDDVDYYLDQEGREDDLKDAMAAFEQSNPSVGQEAFNTLRLVFEHEDKELKYLIQIQINRAHKVGEHPIRVVVNGLMSDLQAHSAEGDLDVRTLIMPHFDSQDVYDSYTNQKKKCFDAFLDRVEQAIRENIGVDEVRRSSESRIIRPSEPVKSHDQWRRSDDCEPVYFGYYGYGDYFCYSWMWSDMCRQEDIIYHHCSVVDDQGQTVLEVGDNFMDGGETNAEGLAVLPDPPLEFDTPELDIPETSTTSGAGGESAGSAGSDGGGGWLGAFFGGDGGGWGGSSGDGGGGGGDGGGCGGGGCGG